MERRKFLKLLGLGSAATVAPVALMGAAPAALPADSGPGGPGWTRVTVDADGNHAAYTFEGDADTGFWRPNGEMRVVFGGNSD